MNNNTGRRSRCRLLAFAAVVGGLAGCDSPPSVIPIMRVVEKTLAREVQHIQAFDAESDRQFFDSARRGLAEAYRADLENAPELTPDWIDSATRVYAAAREHLLRNELDRTAQREARIENLVDAARAQSRAIAVLERQDRLLERFGVDLWKTVVPPREYQP